MEQMRRVTHHADRPQRRAEFDRQLRAAAWATIVFSLSFVTGLRIRRLMDMLGLGTMAIHERLHRITGVHRSPNRFNARDASCRR
jgi:hypothetical protein